MSPLVLLVEDEILVRLTAAVGLEEAGFTVIEADDAEQALELLSNHDGICAVFTDVNMPGSMDGIDLAQLVHTRWPDVRILVTTGGADLSGGLPDGREFVAKLCHAEQIVSYLRRALAA
ncbi:MAG: response regulator [Phenylobacterium sp.]|nr:response regulator [Phenylobacterium sp.]